jgi:hypothetical protein
MTGLVGEIGEGHPPNLHIILDSDSYLGVHGDLLYQRANFTIWG